MYQNVSQTFSNVFLFSFDLKLFLEDWKDTPPFWNKVALAEEAQQRKTSIDKFFSICSCQEEFFSILFGNFHLRKSTTWFVHEALIQYDSVATVGEIRVYRRAHFQSGSRVLKKVFWTFSYLYLWHTMWFHAKKLLKTLNR